MLDMRFAGLPRFVSGFPLHALPDNTDDGPQSVPAAATVGGSTRPGPNFTRHRRAAARRPATPPPHLKLVP